MVAAMRTRMAALLAFALALAVTACGSNDKDQPPAPAAMLPAGSGSANSASPPAPPPKPAPSAVQQKTLAAVAAAMNAHDAKQYAALFGEHATLANAGHPDATGRDAIAAQIQGLLEGFPDLKFTFGRSWSTGNHVIAEWAWSGTNTGAFAGEPATSRPAGVAGIAIATVGDDGAIDELHLYADDATLAAQLDPKADKASFPAPPAPLTATPPVVTDDSPDERKLLEVYAGLYAAIDAKKKAAAMAFFTKDSVLGDNLESETARGLDDASGIYDMNEEAFSHFKQLPLTNQWVVANYIISEGVVKGAHAGKPISMHFVDVIETRAGKVGRFQTWTNSAEVLPLAGAKPAKPAKK
jgi:steroid delta-isomerase-like uncharacterized protein